MSIDLNAIALDFNCSVDEVKAMLLGVTAELPNIVDIINASIDSQDFSSVVMASDMITAQINHFNLTTIQTAIDALIASANAGDTAGCQSHFQSLKSAISELEGVL